MAEFFLPKNSRISGKPRTHRAPAGSGSGPDPAAVQHAMQQAIEALQRANVTLYAVDPRRLYAPEQLLPEQVALRAACYPASSVRRSSAARRSAATWRRAATAAVESDVAWVSAHVSEAVAIRERFATALRAMKLDPITSVSNFVLVPVRDAVSIGAANGS